jgi:acetyl-CoA/propionyl-CoA carboxylase biotin carboxyl carrier protein
MLAKVIAHGRDRDEATRRLDRALAGLSVLGVATSAAFTRALLARDDVRAGAMDTGLVERVLAEGVDGPPDDLVPAAAVAAHLADTAGSTTTPGPWRRAFEEHGVVRIEGDVLIHRERRMRFAARVVEPGLLRIALDGVSRAYAAAATPEAVWVARDGHHLEARTARAARGRTAADSGSLEAPMPGTVLVVNVANGDLVEEGDVLVVVESMKMELAIVAPAAGRVEGLEVAPGDRVAQREVLLAVTV